MWPLSTIGSPPAIKNQHYALKFYHIISSVPFNSSFSPPNTIVSFPQPISLICSYLNHILNLLLHTIDWIHLTTSLLGLILLPTISLSYISPPLDVTIDSNPVLLLLCLSSFLSFICVTTVDFISLGWSQVRYYFSKHLTNNYDVSLPVFKYHICLKKDLKLMAFKP